MNIELTKTEYELLIEVLDTLIQNYEAGEDIDVFSQKSDKVYKLINKIKQ